MVGNGSILVGIALDKTRVEPKDLEIQDKNKSLLKGGFYYGKNMRNIVYGPPRPLMNHGVHRCKKPKHAILPGAYSRLLTMSSRFLPSGRPE
jgi:hypothetical protein